MTLIYGKDNKLGGNLGDELNVWLWEKIFDPILFRHIDDALFLGIGSILSADPYYNKRWINSSKKLIFGTGVRPFLQSKIVIDETYDIAFLRGPLSTYYLGLNADSYITDAAYTLACTNDFNKFLKTEKKYNIGLIPYFASDKLVNWRKISNYLGYHYISPICNSSNIENKLYEITSCKYIISEAMHGAILSDIFRIPWSRFILTTYKHEGSNISDFKWMDWLYSLQLQDQKSIYIRLSNKFCNGLSRISKGHFKLDIIFRKSLEERIIHMLNLRDVEFKLSDDKIYDSAISKIREKIIYVKNKYEI